MSCPDTRSQSSPHRLLTALRGQYAARVEEYSRLAVRVDGAALLDSVVADLDRLLSDAGALHVGPEATASRVSGDSGPHVPASYRQFVIKRAKIARLTGSAGVKNPVASPARGGYDPVADARYRGSAACQWRQAVMSKTNEDALICSEWRTTPKGLAAMTLSLRGHSVRITQRESGGAFYRIMLRGKKQQQWRSLQTTDPHEAKTRAEAFLRAFDPTASIHLVASSSEVPSESDAGAPVFTPTQTDGAAALTLGELWNRYKEAARFRKLDDYTQQDLTSRASIMLGHFGEHRDLTSLDSDDFEEYAMMRRRGGIQYKVRLRSRTGRDLGVRLRSTKPTAARSVQADLKFFRSMLLWAMRKKTGDGRRLLNEDPMEGFVIHGEVNPKRPVATHDRFEKTLDALERLAASETDSWKRQMCLMLATALVVLEGTGRRISAVLGLRWSDLHLDEEGGFADATITFRKELDKKRREKELPLLEHVARRLASYKATAHFPGGTELVFPDREGAGPVNSDRMRQLLEEAEHEAGLGPLDGSKFHAYRRKFATERGHLADHIVMELMGITDAKVFNDCYRKRSDSQLREGLGDVRRALDPRLERSA